ncbi:hypothetical protein ACOYW6_04635 [Parablastomonas sp. CN1-191]|uniref:hypothetical protein n=1 Tax=Parablastomonas sp. CN1-191 TaxID=3400908 RepID=UPI003BF897C5
MHIDFTLERRLPRRTGKPRPSPWKGLTDTLMMLGEGHGELTAHAERPWASVTFSGTRHTLTFAFSGTDGIAAGERFIAALPEHEFALPRQLVADAAVVAVDHRLLPSAAMTVTCELVLLDDQ